MRVLTLSKAAAAAAIVLLALSCSFLEKAVPQAGGTPGAALPSSVIESPPPTEAAPADMEAVTDPRVEGTLALRSVQMELQTAIPSESEDRTLMSIDAAGNVRIETAFPVFENLAVTPESPDWNVVETFIVNGKGYSRTGKIGSAEVSPEEDNALREILYSPTAPGMWLILMPEEAFTATISELKGGFDAVRYTVEGSLELGDVWGEFWVDEQTGALVGANLSISETLLHPMESDTGGEVLIYFNVERADVPPIALP